MYDICEERGHGYGFRESIERLRAKIFGSVKRRARYAERLFFAYEGGIAMADIEYAIKVYLSDESWGYIQFTFDGTGDYNVVHDISDSTRFETASEAMDYYRKNIQGRSSSRTGVSVERGSVVTCRVY